MIGRYFEPDDKICLIFDNVYYDKLRERHDAKWGDNELFGAYRNQFMYADMPRAREEADTFEQGIKALGFSEEQIHRHSDV